MAGTVVVDAVKSSTTGAPTFQNTSGTEIGTLCRAWVNMNGASGQTAIRASFNISSVTRNGTGDYTFSFTNAMPDANFSPVAICRMGPGANGGGSGGNMVIINNSYTMNAANIRLNNYNTLVGNQDVDIWSVAVFR